MPQPTIVLVHGAWADGSSWNPVSTHLQGAGLTVLTPPNLLRGVAGDAAYVSSFIAQRTTGPVVLVGHALGGVTIGQTAEARRRKIKALVYVCGLMPPSGMASREMTAGDPDMLFRRSREVAQACESGTGNNSWQGFFVQTCG